jgi:AAA15 family ATPase/GTPase
MFIKKIKIKNFKSFIDETIEFQTPNGVSGSGLNIFVGENNAGKSNVFEAVDFLRNGLPSGKGVSDLKNKKAMENDEMSVEILFEGKISELIEIFSDKKYQSYVFTQNGSQFLSLKRSSKIHEITQNGKTVEMTIKKIGIWNSEVTQFENPAGIDSAFTKLFEIDFIWANTNPEDIANFGSTRICGKLLKSITASFFTGKQWEKFEVEHKKTFHDGDESLKAKTKEIEERTQKIFAEQFGSAKIEFDFQLPDSDSFFKNTKIKIDDGIETAMSEKGSGMQRSVALALLQVYAENLIQNPENSDAEKPFFLFLDEPEICLHPQAQKKLLTALKILTSKKQIFITSHSPYFIDPDLIGGIFRFENGVTGSKTFSCDDLDTILALKEKENRVFFFHHRDLFFAKKIFFFEGIEDYQRFSLFCEKNDRGNLIQDFYFLAGKDDWKHFKKLCDDLKIDAKFIFDLDVISKSSNTFTDESIKKKIEEFKKEIKQNDGEQCEKCGKSKNGKVPKEERCEPLLDENLNPIELALKNEILEDLKAQNIFVLRYGMIENYLYENGEIVKDGHEIEKEAELRSIFTS